jgi:hypothetical protein
VCRGWPNGPRIQPSPGLSSSSTSLACMPRSPSKRSRLSIYKAGGDRELTIVLVRDLVGKRPDQMFYCTKLEWSAPQILTAYSYRWAIECTFENCKQFLELEDPANRLLKAVERTAPMALMIYSLVVVWFHKTGHQSNRFLNRPWYQRKQEPSFADLLTTLRRVSLEEKNARSAFESPSPKNLACTDHRSSQPSGVISGDEPNSRSVGSATSN